MHMLQPSGGQHNRRAWPTAERQQAQCIALVGKRGTSHLVFARRVTFLKSKQVLDLLQHRTLHRRTTVLIYTA